MKLSKRERRKLADMIREIVESILMSRDDAQISALHKKYQRPGDGESAAEMRSIFEDVLGLDLGDDVDFDSPEAVMERAEQKFQESQEQFAAKKAAREERQAQRIKSRKQLAKEARQEADDQRLSQSIREIYRKLVSALHPDREADPVERERKTGLMQRVNQAYEKNNLLQLLELQLELEHIDQGALDNIGEERLRDYIKILREQADQLNVEIHRVASGFASPFEGPYFDMRPESVMHRLSTDIANARRANQELKRDLGILDDVNALKSWLRYTKPPSAADDEDIPF
ncbi:MAG: molecular chaperone DnaJ [Burkholderiales bacterium]